jgi:hypothetical protein
MNTSATFDIVRAPVVGADGVYVRGVDLAENTVQAREESMRVQLAGASSAVSAAEARVGVDEARREVTQGRGAGYEVGFGYVKSFDRSGADGIELEYVITDGTRVANLHVIVSRTALSVLGLDTWMTEADEKLRAWALDELYRAAGAIARGDDRYAVLLTRHPLHLVAPPP